MSKLVVQIGSFLRNEDGPTAVEYAVMLSLILASCMAGIRTFGDSTASTFSRVSSSLESATGGGSSGGNGNNGGGNGNGNGNGGGNGSNSSGNGNGNSGQGGGS